MTKSVLDYFANATEEFTLAKLKNDARAGGVSTSTLGTFSGILDRSGELTSADYTAPAYVDLDDLLYCDTEAIDALIEPAELLNCAVITASGMTYRIIAVGEGRDQDAGTRKHYELRLREFLNG